MNDMVFGSNIKSVPYVWGERSGNIIVHSTLTLPDHILDALKVDKKHLYVHLNSNGVYEVKEKIVVVEQPKKKEVDEEEAFVNFKKTLPKEYSTAYFRRVSKRFEIELFLRPGIVYETEFGWFGYPRKNDVISTPLTLERSGWIVKGDPTLPSSYIKKKKNHSTFHADASLSEHISGLIGRDEKFISEIFNICNVQNNTEMELDIPSLDLQTFQKLELLILNSTTPPPPPSKKKAKKVEMPKDQKKLLELAKTTKKNTEEAIKALKENLQVIAGKVVSGPIVGDDPGAEFRETPQEMARKELKRSRMEEEDSDSLSWLDSSSE